MLVSNAVTAQTKCRSAAVDEEETGSRQGAPAAAGEGRLGRGSVSLTRGPCRGWFTCGWRTYSLPGKAGRAWEWAGKGYRRGKPWAPEQECQGLTSTSQPGRVPEEVAPEQPPIAAEEEHSLGAPAGAEAGRLPHPGEAGLAGGSAWEGLSLASLSPLCKGTGAPHPFRNAGRFSGRLLGAGQDH